jgi:hypothetical protein
MRSFDTQRQKCYDWEKEILQWKSRPIISQEETVEYVKAIFKDIHLWAPVVKFTKRSGAESDYDGKYLNFSPKTRNKEIILHEISHCVVTKRNKDGHTSSHGPIWMATYIQFLVKYLGYDEQMLKETASARKIAVASKGCMLASY